MLLFRAMSMAEFTDYRTSGLLQIAGQTLEAKQSFRSVVAVMGFVERADAQGFIPRYARTLTFFLDTECFPANALQEQILDGHLAVTIAEEHLPQLNNCINFVSSHVI
jgi:hypothetical protein